MSSAALVQLALKKLGGSQKELAAHIGVSTAQISKWKKDEHISVEMMNKFLAIIDIGERVPDFVLWAGSLESAIKWERLIQHLADVAVAGEETGYDTDLLTDELDLLCWRTVDTLAKMGVTVPETFPAELNIDYDEAENSWELIDKNPTARIIRMLFESLVDVYGFYKAYVINLIFNSELDYSEANANIDSCLFSLAATKLKAADVDGLTKMFASFRHQVVSDYQVWLNELKGQAFRAGIPLEAELLDLIYRDNDELRDKAEEKSLGHLFASSPLHPDIYMNELLQGMRVIHQVLPVILKKLGIEQEFKLNESELKLS